MLEVFPEDRHPRVLLGGSCVVLEELVGSVKAHSCGLVLRFTQMTSICGSLVAHPLQSLQTVDDILR